MESGKQWIVDLRILYVLSITTLASFITGFNARLALVGFPVIARELNTGIDGVLWILQGYMIGSSIMQLIVGGLADLYGRVKLFRFGFILFSIAALIASYADNWIILAAARILQGFGGAFLITLSVTILTDNAPRGLLGTLLGINGMAFNVGAIFGLSVSGVIIDLLGWRWLYLIQIPISLFALILSTRVLREAYNPPSSIHLDIAGFFSFTSFITLLSLYLTLLLRGFPRNQLLLLSIMSLLSLIIIFILIEIKSTHSIINIMMLKNWQFTAGIIAQFLYAIGFGASLTLFVILLEIVKEMTPTLTGLGLMPYQISFLITGVLGGRLSDKYGFAPITICGLSIAALALYALSQPYIQNEVYSIVTIIIMLGIGTGLFVAPNTSSIMSAVPIDKRGVAAALRTLSFNIGFLMSLNIAFIILSSYVSYEVASEIIIVGKIMDSYGSHNLINALSRAFTLQALFMASAIPFSITRLKIISKKQHYTSRQ